MNVRKTDAFQRRNDKQQFGITALRLPVMSI